MKVYGIITIILLDVLIVIIYLAMMRDVVMAGFILLLLVVDIFVGSILRAITRDKSPSRTERTEKDTISKGNGSEKADENGLEKGDSGQESVSIKKNRQNSKIQMLQYGTAILAFLSMLTTAEGMKDFVFEKDWMAYLGSMAVQMILVVFSLLLCQFYVKITSQGHWKHWVRQVAINGLTLFFVLSMFVSSVFSFSYISNNAYYQNWSSDRDIIIDNFLTLETDRLRRENEYRGRLILNEIRERAEKNLQVAADSMSNQVYMEIEAAVTNSDLQVEIDAFEREFGDLWESTGASQYETTVGEGWRYDFTDIRALYGQRRLQQLDILIVAYKQYEDDYADQIREVWNILDHLSEAISSIDDQEDAEGLEDILQTALTRLETIEDHLGELKIGVNGVGDYYFDRDFETPRTIFRNKVDVLVNDLEMLKISLAEILNKIAESQSGMEEVDANHIISEIYALGMDESVLVENIQTELSGMVENALRMDVVDSTVLQKIVELLDLIEKYEQYLNLSRKIEGFENSNLSKTYNIEVPGKKNGGVSAEAQLISEQEWSKIREDDFFEFISMVKALPYIDDDSEESVYDISDTVSAANEIRRDLLGELTDLERAVLHFKYDHKIMALFSLFMAVFLDLGAFLTGCIIYLDDALKGKEQVDKKLEEENTVNDIDY